MNRKTEYPNADHVTMSPGRVLIYQRPCEKQVELIIPQNVSEETKRQVQPFDYIVQEVGAVPKDSAMEAPPCKPGDRVLLTAQCVSPYVIAELGLFDRDQRIRAVVLSFDQISGVFED